ncbi:MAG: valine--tRNA ligase, partial [Kiritimatiellaceae bacterium]|nr:valine--tRNA ligase [Kiritimatiellaceae bacterium]
FKPNRKEDEARFQADVRSIEVLLGAKSIVVDGQFVPQGSMTSALSGPGVVYMSIDGLVDKEAEVAKLKKQLDLVENGINGIVKKLSNAGFMSKAPADVVAGEEKRKAELIEKRDKILKLLETFSA